MASKLRHRLQTELDSTEADDCVTLFDGWVQLSQCQHRLSIGLFVEGDGHSESCRIIVDVGAVVEDQPLGWNDLEVVEATRVQGAVRGGHVEARSAAWPHVHLSDDAGESVRT